MVISYAGDAYLLVSLSRETLLLWRRRQRPLSLILSASDTAFPQKDVTAHIVGEIL